MSPPPVYPWQPAQFMSRKSFLPEATALGAIAQGFAISNGPQRAASPAASPSGIS